MVLRFPNIYMKSRELNKVFVSCWWRTLIYLTLDPWPLTTDLILRLFLLIEPSIFNLLLLLCLSNHLLKWCVIFTCVLGQISIQRQVGISFLGWNDKVCLTCKFLSLCTCFCLCISYDLNAYFFKQSSHTP